MLDKIKLKGCASVYGPLEDSYLMAEQVEKYAFGSVLDLGTGTGISGIAAALKGCNVTFADIDSNAIRCAKENATANGVSGNFIESDMFESINGKFNTIVFNPPYLESARVAERDMALDGGASGRELIDKFLKEYPGFIENEYVVLLLESSINGYEADVKRHNFKVVAKEHFFFEEIAVLKASSGIY
ncbi:MAG: methyltransferase [Candidatus Marsarchaeota archaeon]|nr:methyltransferase [Candidatus Marsarchaeota archaeon]